MGRIVACCQKFQGIIAVVMELRTSSPNGYCILCGPLEEGLLYKRKDLF